MISIIMGTRYTRQDTALLKRAVESIRMQTYSNFEFLICDNGSTKAAMVYLERCAMEDERIKLVRRADCLDLARKLNHCLTVARGEYIGRMDDDDYSHPDRLEKELQYLINNKGIAFVGCNVSLICNGERTGECQLPKRPGVEDFYITQPYIHPSLLFRAKSLEVVKGYCENKDCILCEDYDLLLRLYKAGYVGANIQEVLLDYTIPSKAKGNRKMRHRINEVKTRYKHFKDLGRLPSAMPYVMKPLIVGVIPGAILKHIKQAHLKRGLK